MPWQAPTVDPSSGGRQLKRYDQVPAPAIEVRDVVEIGVPHVIGEGELLVFRNDFGQHQDSRFGGGAEHGAVLGGEVDQGLWMFRAPARGEERDERAAEGQSGSHGLFRQGLAAEGRGSCLFPSVGLEAQVKPIGHS